MAVPKKRTSKSKKKIRSNVWKEKAYRSAAKVVYLANYDDKLWFFRSRSARGFSKG
uniref:Large ribosomal subunit protein bL32c n=2 Tax=Cephalotaxus TaxID=50178 RepID=A0A7R7DZP6_CEPHW|nr:ribosomal protein L32 [Cephalotaxus lanceolata]QRG00553.1 ribosomal protein L32 [Cephalotaxus lanceolata]ULU28372.1 ribosomal protein L32 [Cephalotaxus hainanensis]BCK52061.1 ribosomal protein L32 [Cephalotaxus harringtonia var. wilsoniana]